MARCDRPHPPSSGARARLSPKRSPFDRRPRRATIYHHRPPCASPSSTSEPTPPACSSPTSTLRPARSQELLRRSQVTRLGARRGPGGLALRGGDRPRLRHARRLPRRDRLPRLRGATSPCSPPPSATPPTAPSFAARVREDFGLDARVLSGDEEAQLTFLGAMSGRSPARSRAHRRDRHRRRLHRVHRRRRAHRRLSRLPARRRGAHERAPHPLRPARPRRSCRASRSTRAPPSCEGLPPRSALRSDAA